MPEGPEVETIRRTLERQLIDQEIEGIWRSDLALRTPSKGKDFEFLKGSRITRLSRVGKTLIIETDRAQGLLIHFGMSGRLFFPLANEAVEKHTHLRIRFKRSEHELRFIDPRRFGDLKLYRNISQKDEHLLGLGPDGILLTPQEAKAVARRVHQSERPVKTVLLDQNIVSGIGNIYACEALYLAKISPLRKASELQVRAIEGILLASQAVMTRSVENKGTTFLSYLDGNGEKGGNQEHLRVFARENEPCKECGRKIIRIVQSGRSTFYCAQCQK